MRKCIALLVLAGFVLVGSGCDCGKGSAKSTSERVSYAKMFPAGLTGAAQNADIMAMAPAADMSMNVNTVSMAPVTITELEDGWDENVKIEAEIDPDLLKQ